MTPGAIRYRIVTTPAHGTLRSGATVLAAGSVVSSASVSYTPASGYSGPDSFTFSAFDSTSSYPRQPATASASLTVGDQPGGASVAISGAPPTLQAGASAQLTATVTNAAPGVTWSVNGVAGGNATIGTVSSSGLYQAPAAVPPGGSVTVRATSTAAPAAFAEVVIGIEPTPPPEPSPGNLIANPSFESTTVGWGGWQASVARVAQAGAPDGGYVAQVTRSSGTSFTIDDGAGSVPSTTAGRDYTATAWVKAAGSASVGKSVTLRARERAAGGSQVADVGSPAVTLSNTWQKLLVTRTTTTTGGTLGLRISFGGAVAGSSMYADAFALTSGAGTPTPNQAPTAAFAVSPGSPQTGQQVTFTDTSTDGDGAIASRAWDLDNDGSYDDGTGATAARGFTGAGTFTVGLRVVDDDGAPATTSRQVTVSAAPPSNSPPTASFTHSPTSPQTGESVTFTDTSTDTDGTITSRAWDLDNDGSYDDGTGATAARTFTTAGTFTVGLRAVNDDLAPATTSRQVTVSSGGPANQAPTASFTFSPTSPQTGQSVTFTDTSTDSDGTITSRAWDLDNDGSYDDGTGATAARTFTTAGTFTVGLRSVNDDLAPATTSRQVTVTGAPPQGNLIANPSFEVNTVGWAGFQGSLTREAGVTGAPNGSAIVRVNRSSGTYFTIDAGDNVTSTAAATYVATAWVKAASSSSVGKTIQLRLRERTPAGATIADASSPVATLTNSWQQITVQRTTTAGNRLGVRLSHTSAVSGDAFHADALSLVLP